MELICKARPLRDRLLGTCQLDRSTMCRYSEEAGNLLGATIVAAMWKDALHSAGVISTDATSAMIQPAKDETQLRQACKKGHFFTAVVDCDYVLFAYAEKHTQEFVKPQHRYLELAPNRWSTTRAKLQTSELERPLGPFTIPKV